MKSKSLLIISTWSAVTIVFALLMVLGTYYSDNPTQWLLVMFNDWWVVFFISLIFTGAIAYFMKEPEANLKSQIETVGHKLDSISKEIAEIKKAIED